MVIREALFDACFTSASVGLTNRQMLLLPLLRFRFSI